MHEFGYGGNFFTYIHELIPTWGGTPPIKAVFLDSKRLQDRSINGLVAVIPYILSVPYQFGFISDSIIQFYVLVVLAARIYIFVNAGFLKGDDGENRYGPEPEH